MSGFLGAVLAAALVIGSFAGSGCVHDELDDVREVKIETHVEDWRDEVIYQLMTDRFANGDTGNDHRVDNQGIALARYQGGDYQGIIDRLDYLEELGVTAIWISPIVLNVDYDAGVDGYHGYWQVNLDRLNPHFGDLATLRRMVQASHDRGIKVILDIVTNHFGQVFYYDINLNGVPDESVFGSGTRSPLERLTEYDPDYDPRGIQARTSLGEAGLAPIRFFDMPEIFRVPPSPAVFREPDSYNRRGRVTDWNVMEQVVYGDFPGGLKDVKTERPEVRDAFVDSFTRWVLETDLDGFRIDTLKHVEYEFWEDFAPRVRERLAAAGKENFLMFGEAFDGDDALVGSYTMPGRIDSVFYFPHKFQVFDDVFGRGAPTTNIERLYEQRDEHYGTQPQPGGIGIPPTRALVNFIDNHDLPRYLFSFPGRERLHAAIAYLLTMDGIPCLYYGTEQNFAGGNDPANREPLWWSAYLTDGDTFEWTKRLIQIRKDTLALRRGGFDLRWTTDHTEDESDAGVVAFERTTPDGDYALVVINTQGDQPSRTSFEDTVMEVTAPAGQTLRDLLSDETFEVSASQTLDVAVGPYATRILVPAS